MKKMLKKAAACILAAAMAVTACNVKISQVKAADYGVNVVTNSDLKNSYSSGQSLAPLKGIDVSRWQTDINWFSVKSDDIDFAIIQAGYRDQNTGALTEDSKFTTNIYEASQAAIPVGLYFLSQAVTVEEAVEEAEWLISKASAYTITFPLVIDFEYKSNSNGYTGRLYEANLSADTATAIVSAFCDRIEQAGYSSMLYVNSYMLNNKLNKDTLTAKYKIWLANYQNPAMTTYGEPTTVYGGAFTYFQFSSTGAVDGISTNVDLDYYYGDTSFVTAYYNDLLEYYAPVFDAAFYANKYPKLVSNYGSDAIVLLDHFLKYGMDQGLQGSEEFEVNSYRARYDDLNEVYGEYLKQYYLHYLTCGKAEGRDATVSDDTVQDPYCNIEYRTHVQNVGWQSWVSNGETAGTEGQSLRLEGLNVIVDTNLSGSIQYRTHVQNVGWQEWKTNGQISGTSGQGLRLEAMQIMLTGYLAECYDIYYRVHAENIGWMDWAKNGESAGTEGCELRLEAMQIVIVEKGSEAPGSTDVPFKQLSVSYQTHVQNIGWQGAVSNGGISGTSGQSLRLEGIKISVSGFEGGISYRTHVQNVGWQNWVSNGAMSGTSGQSLRLEAIQIKLTGEMAEMFDVYYRVHAQNIGWMGWAKNGASAGTAGYSYRLEAIEIQLVPKGSAAPGSTTGAYRSK